jgi:hypothetical protein
MRLCCDVLRFQDPVTKARFLAFVADLVGFLCFDHLGQDSCLLFFSPVHIVYVVTQDPTTFGSAFYSIRPWFYL